MKVLTMTSVSENQIKFILNLKRKGIKNKDVLNAMETIDRGLFLEGIFQERSQDDIALPINCGQTISQPSVVAKMIENLEINKNCKVLEVGTGSGYQTAILSRLSRRVYSIERHEFLKKKAEELLLKNFFKNVTCIFGDGSLGMENQAPFDRIIVSAAAEDIPQILIKQLKYGGIMVLPVGFSKEEQTLIKVRKDTDQTHYEEIFKVRFVPLVEGLQNIRNYQDG